MMRADDIVRQRFTKVFRGYDVQEVDLFLDEVIRSMDTLEKERNQLLARLESLLRELERCEQEIAAKREDAAAFPVQENEEEPVAREIFEECGAESQTESAFSEMLQPEEEPLEVTDETAEALQPEPAAESGCAAEVL